MTAFVLVHGAWHGGWCWTRVAGRLGSQGHRVFTPTLTGLGERAHLLTRDVDLFTHVQDVVELIEAEELDQVVLCGHSYGGMVITGAADKLPERVDALVYLDAFLPEPGQSLFDQLPPERRQAQSERDPSQWLMPSPPASFWKVRTAEDRAWVDRRTRPQPIATMAQKLPHGRPWMQVRKAVYVRATEHEAAHFGPIFERLKSDSRWEVLTVPSGHDAMIDEPERLTQILLSAARPPLS